mmetsp:Transcript_18094/g.45365  ORF Transcript_18094/g.45365 Transcript_18094/m.45365 type:complete len:208 (-) Transcript_18094:6731-7354(-)
MSAPPEAAEVGVCSTLACEFLREVQDPAPAPPEAFAGASCGGWPFPLINVARAFSMSPAGVVCDLRRAYERRRASDGGAEGDGEDAAHVAGSSTCTTRCSSFPSSCSTRSQSFCCWCWSKTGDTEVDFRREWERRDACSGGAARSDFCGTSSSFRSGSGSNSTRLVVSTRRGPIRWWCCSAPAIATSEPSLAPLLRASPGERATGGA